MAVLNGFSHSISNEVQEVGIRQLRARKQGLHFVSQAPTLLKCTFHHCSDLRALASNSHRHHTAICTHYVLQRVCARWTS